MLHKLDPHQTDEYEKLEKEITCSNIPTSNPAKRQIQQSNRLNTAVQRKLMRVQFTDLYTGTNVFHVVV